jgi:hypothetical protein
MIPFTGDSEMKKAILMLSLAASLMGTSLVAHADLNGFLKGVNNRALSDIKNFNDMLSRQFGIPVPDVEAIVRSVPNPADAFMILQLGEMAQVAPAVVLQKYQRSKGKGWGNLARELGIKPGAPEFHALKRGNLSFTGERSGNAMEQGGGGQGHGQGRGKGHRKD